MFFPTPSADLSFTVLFLILTFSSSYLLRFFMLLCAEGLRIVIILFLDKQQSIGTVCHCGQKKTLTLNYNNKYHVEPFVYQNDVSQLKSHLCSQKIATYAGVALLIAMPRCIAQTSLNLVRQNIINTNSGATTGYSPLISSGGNQWRTGGTATGFTTSIAQYNLLYDGNQPDDQGHCISGRIRDSNNVFVPSIVTLAFNSDLVGVQTIITTVCPGHAATFTLTYKSSTVTTWSSICSALTCVFGTNDLTNPPQSSPNINALQFTFTKNLNLCLCEIWAYSYKNYAPGALKIDFYYAPKTGSGTNTCRYLQSVSYDAQPGQALSMGYMSAGNMLGCQWSVIGSFTASSHTCNYVKNQPGGSCAKANSYIIVTLPYYMIIKEIYNQGDVETDFYLWDPIDPAISTTTASGFNSLMQSSYTDKPQNYQYIKLLTGGNQIDTFSFQCTDTQCTDWATNKVIITNQQQYNDFYTCGFAIMAEIVTCAVTNTNLVTQCNHSQLGTFTGTTSTITVGVGSTSTPLTFSCPDPLSAQCFALPLSLNVGCAKTYSLMCASCTTCGTSCATPCGSFSDATSFATVLFTQSTTSDSATMSVTPTAQGSYSCYIQCAMGSQTQSSSAFQIQACGTCAQTVLSATAAFTPTSPGKVPIVPTGVTTGATLTFTAPTNSYAVCTGSTTCAYPLTYILSCKNQALAGSFAPPNTWYSTSTPGTPSISVYGQQLTLQGIVWLCQITASQTSSSSTVTSGTFTIQFDMCTNPADSCPANTIWQAPTTQNQYWVPPADMIVYLTNLPVTNTLDYSKWKDNFNNKCGAAVCGSLQFTYLDADTDLPLNFTSYITTTDNTASQTVTFSVQTSNLAYAGVYNVKIVATLANDVTWTGTRPSSSWGNFTVTIVNPCSPNPLCQYTSMVAQTTSQTAMTVKLDGISVVQPFTPFLDFISSYCSTALAPQVISCSISARSYAIVNAVTNIALPADLCGISPPSATAMQITCATTNFAYTGVYQVYIKAQVNLQYFGGVGSNSVNGNTFTLTVDACASCAQSTLIALGSTDTKPTSYSIGVENTPGSTLFSPFQNMAAKYCGISTQCGTPSYAIICVSGCTAGQTPPFSTNTIAVDPISGKMIQKSWTTTVALAGVYTVRIMVTLDLSSYGQSTLQIAYSNNYQITINWCVPLPCAYNSISPPVVTGALANVNHLPSTQVVLCDGTVTTDFFSSYTDAVSQRCSGTTYADMCGAKQYSIQLAGTGAALPFPVTVTASVGGTWTMSSSTSLCSLVNIYQAQIDASFSSTALSPSNHNTQYQFKISVEYPDPCNPLICGSNTFSAIDSTLDLFPTSFTTWVNNTWGSTNFSNFRDVKSDTCNGKPGGSLVGAAVVSCNCILASPVCGLATYQVYLVSNNQPLSSIFGASNVIIAQIGTLEWSLQVRTSQTTLDGDHLVYIQATLNGMTLNSANFNVTVLDPCNPYNCSTTQFYPIATGIKPQNITVMVDQGYVPSNQALWTDSVTASCSNAAIGPFCGQPIFNLLLTNGSAVPFSYSVSTNQLYTSVSISVNDPSLAGQVYQVFLTGYELDVNNKAYAVGNSSTFTVTIVQNNATNYGALTSVVLPIFDTFPSDQTFLTNTSYSPVSVSASASKTNGTISSVSTQLGAAIGFVTYQVSGSQISFLISPTSTTPAGDYVIKVTAIDESGASVTKSFKVSIQNPPPTLNFTAPTFEQIQALAMQNQTNWTSNSTPILQAPITATILSISITGLIEIAFSSPVIPVRNITLITNNQYFMTFEQNSVQPDQTLSFSWTVTESTPFKLFVQLIFVSPMDVSQGNIPDKIKLWMQRSALMTPDTIGLYKTWKSSTKNSQKTVQHTSATLDVKYTDTSAYCKLAANAPLQVADIEAASMLNDNLSKVAYGIQIIFWGPFFLQIAVPQAMEKTWLIFGSLQIVNMMSQLNIKSPANVQGLAKSVQKMANSQLSDNEQLYPWLRKLGSKTEQSGSNSTTQNSTDLANSLRLLQSVNVSQSATVISPYENSKFFGHGSTDLVLQSGSQLFIAGFLTVCVAFFGLFFWKSFLWCLPKRVYEVFHQLRHRLFYSFPLRILSQQYLQITMAALINLKFQTDVVSLEQKSNLGISVLVIILYTLAFPIWIIFFVRKYKIMITYGSVFTAQWNTLFLKVDLRNYLALFLLAASLIRRFLFAFTVTQVSMNVIQLVMVMYIQQFITIFILYVKPMEDNIGNITLIFNEVMLSMLCINLYLFTDFVPNPVIRYTMGQIFLYSVYIMVIFTFAVWSYDVYLMVKWQYKVLKFKRELAIRKNKILQHNKHVDIIGKHNQVQTNVIYKKKNPVIDDQMSVIESVGSLENQRDGDLSGGSQRNIQQQTIATRKQEFLLQMKEMKEKNNFDEDVRVNQMLNQTAEVKRLEIKRPVDEFDDIFKDVLPVQSLQKLQQQIQKESDWPVSPRHAHIARANDLSFKDENQNRQERWSWDNEVQGSNAERWNALPSDALEPDSSNQSLNVGPEAEYRINHVGKIPTQKIDKKSRQSALWISQEEQDKQAKFSTIQQKDDYVFEAPRNQRKTIVDVNDPFYGLL